MKLIAFLLLISVLLESTIITLPLTLLIILFSAVVLRDNDVFILAFFSGLFLDILTIGAIGLSSLFFVTFIMLIFLYQKKFEIESLSFVSIVALLGSFLYLFITSSNHLISGVLFSVIFISISFFVFKKTRKKVSVYA